MKRFNSFLSISAVLAGSTLLAQEPDYLSYEEFYILSDNSEDLDAIFKIYERFNTSLGADSVRLCGGHPCIGWVEDKHENGQLKHRGYYDQGRLTIYKNYHSNGALEREFKSIDARKSIMRMYHANGNIRSVSRYVNGVALEYQEHYENGQLRYHEEKHRTEPYYLRMDLYAANGDPISLFQLVDNKKVIFHMKEFYPGGKLHNEGKAQYDKVRMDTKRIGEWRSYTREGEIDLVQNYVDGKGYAVVK